ncbi:hypothetical protein TSTA_078590 [Talaromyces stipitatus ATCC 10500]|uniref:Uncharacterized protein n=1 Tax=Talaromyces stipitatus (strain ATCC 10500 / CBS 375.48 / QM 6759 / NRRL 1006) TaxID=441959 RepID=B8LXK1_TALSN|nr:uncharacterized protein TSTA_078590 [Talaromyces stipitatus ATCC 10500]EED24502.1 hypothetical protein TSTA_078590 [Talaromyces stipitatus ATCC 10500]
MTTAIEQSVAYYNGKVYTLNDSRQVAEDFIVTPQGTFSTVGTRNEVLRIARAYGIITYNLHGHRDNTLKLDIAAHSVYASKFLANEREGSFKALIDQTPKLATKHVRTSFVKILLDGVPLPPLFSSAGNIEQDK